VTVRGSAATVYIVAELSVGTFDVSQNGVRMREISKLLSIVII